MSRILKTAYLSGSQVVTTLSTLIIAAVLSRVLESKADYGTYQQTLLVYTFLAQLLALGLPAASYYFFSKSFCVNKRKKVEIEHTESVKITTIGVPSKNVDAEPLTTSAINVDSAPITDDAYPAICPKGFIARAFKFPKINPKKEKLIIINIENHAKLKEK